MRKFDRIFGYAVYPVSREFVSFISHDESGDNYDENKAQGTFKPERIYRKPLRRTGDED